MVTSLRNTKFSILLAAAPRVQAPDEVDELNDLSESWDLDDCSWFALRSEWASDPW